MKRKIVFATNNAHKLQEIKSILGEDWEVLGLNDINCLDEIEEWGTSFEENACIKAQYVYDHYGLNCFADDSGLEVKALDNAPGIYSARYSGEDHNSEKNMDKLLYNLQGVEERKARFRTVIAYIEEEKNISSKESSTERLPCKKRERGIWLRSDLSARWI